MRVTSEKRGVKKRRKNQLHGNISPMVPFAYRVLRKLSFSVKVNPNERLNQLIFKNSIHQVKTSEIYHTEQQPEQSDYIDETRSNEKTYESKYDTNYTYQYKLENSSFNLVNFFSKFFRHKS